MLRKQKKEGEIAEALDVSRETIVRDVRWLKQNIAYDFNLITNEVLGILHNRIDGMEDRDLIAFLGKLVPQRIEAFSVEKREVNVNTTVTNIDASLRDYDWALEEAARLALQSNNKKQPLDTPQATS